MSQASRMRGCAAKRRMLATGLTGRSGPAEIAGLDDRRKYQKIAIRRSAQSALQR